MHALRKEAAKRVHHARSQKRSSMKRNPALQRRLTLAPEYQKDVAIQTMPESYIFEAVIEQLKKKRKAGMYADIQQETRKRIHEQDDFNQKKIGKMYLNYNAPDYLIEDHPGENKVPCKPLIAKVKADQSATGLTKEQCEHEVDQFFIDKWKKKEAVERRKRERRQKAQMKKYQLEKLMKNKMRILNTHDSFKDFGARADSVARSIQSSQMLIDDGPAAI